jgi:pectate lyase
MKKIVLFLIFTCLLSIPGAVTAQVNFDLVGFATQNGGTTGGQAGTVVNVSNYADLKSYAESTTAYTIMVNGTISNGANGGSIAVRSNKSIIGVGSTAYLFGVGLDINSHSNIIIQNLKISLTGVTTRVDTPGVYSSTGDNGLPQILTNEGDCIGIRGSSTNIWIDHCELFSVDPNIQTNKDLYDGLIDIKGQSGFITVSWCYMHDHHKGNLVGASETDLWVDRKITYHHNYYNKVHLRIPMYRGATGHFFNNYIVGAVDASEIRNNSCVRVEKNYYEALRYSIYTPNDFPGLTERIDNIEISRTPRAYPGNCVATIPYDYSAVLTSVTDDVKTVVPLYAGVGRIGNDCNGDNMGTAYLDSCGICVGGNTGVQACVVDCNNVQDGTAFIDGCNICVGGNTGNTACDAACTWTEYQAETGTMITGGTIDSNNAGFTGTGFANTPNAVGAWYEIVVNVATAGVHNLRFRYSNGSAVDRTVSVVVNASQQINSLSFPNTGSFTTWNSVVFSLNLVQGNNTIRFVSLTSSGAANLDRLDVCQSAPLGVSEINTEAFRLYPNPVTNILTIELGNEFTANSVIKLYDISGKLISTKKVKETTQTLNMQQLQAGVYLIKVSNGSKNVVKRIVKE